MTLSLLDVTGAPAKTAVALAVLTMDPASMSAWVTVWLAVTLVLAPGARTRIVGAGTVRRSSATANGATSATLPVLVRVYV